MAKIDRMGFKKTPVTYALITANIAIFMFFGTLFSGPASSVWTLSNQNVLSSPISIIASGFMHANIIHLAVNMFALWSFRVIEEVLGSKIFTLAYFGSLLGASLVVGTLSSVPTVGASGAIFGLFGLMFTYGVFRNARKQLFILLAINLFITFAIPNISWQGHLGGLITGAIIGVILNRKYPAVKDPNLSIAAHPNYNQER